jgi:hypothetical protein
MTTETQSLTVGGIIQNGFLTGLKNAASLVGAVALWALTIWIPYLNVGTTIGLLGLIAAMSKGDVISPTAIFRSEYRKQMGEFFLVQAFIAIGVTIGLLFLVIPGIVIAMAWGLAPLLVIDRGMNPTEALQKSNDLTSGKKWVIFGGTLLTSLATQAGVILLATIFNKIHWSLGGLVALAGFVLMISVTMGAQAHIYGTLTGSAPTPTRDVNQGMMIGGAIGTIVLCIGIVSGINALTRKSYEDEYAKRMRELDAKYETTSARARPAAQPAVAPVAAQEPALDLAQQDEVKPATRLAPSFQEEARQTTTRKVANAKAKKRSYRY